MTRAKAAQGGKPHPKATTAAESRDGPSAGKNRGPAAVDLDAILSAGGPWQRAERIGGQLLLQGDCREIMPVLPKVDAVVTDPPYGIGFAAQPTRYQRANGMARRAWDSFAPDLKSVVAAGREAIIWGGQYFDLRPSRGWLVWSKVGNAPSMADAELAWTSLDMNARSFEKTVKSASLEKDLQRSPHPSQKPITLMEWCLGFLPNARTILDPFAGSGTVAVACQRLGRQSISIELDPGYFATACRRVDEAARQPALFTPEPQAKPTQETLL